MGVDRSLWGPGAWLFLHSVTFAYPTNPSDVDKREMTRFFSSVGRWLPCAKCRNHFQNALKTSPPNVDSRESLSRWLCDVHNEVNARLGKPTLSYEKACKVYGVSVADVEDNCGCSGPPGGDDGEKSSPTATTATTADIVVPIVVVAILLAAVAGCVRWWQRGQRASTTSARK